MVTTTAQAKAAAPEIRVIERFVRMARAPRRRSMRAFAEQELYLSDGPYKGLRFNCDRQPFSRLFLDAVDSGHWRRFAAVGPTQTGKSFLCFVLPTLYHLFEVGENVVCGVPDLGMVNDKFHEDFLPAIERTRYRELMPRAGDGAKGGKVKEAIRFANGATLRFMTAGSGDKGRAGFTSRILVVTEVDGLDKSAETSLESDKINQLEGRVKAYGSSSRVYLECTVTVEKGRIWREYLGGTESRIMLLCPHCRRFVFPDREHLVGHDGAANEVEAWRQSAFHCPACGEEWDEANRRRANLDAKLLHRGQEIDEAGEIHGDLPPTFTLGFRWSAANNLLQTAGDVGRDEWLARQDHDEANAEKKMRQFVWALPYIPPIVDMTPIHVDAIAARVGETTKGILPPQTEKLTLGIDLRKRELHWVLIAWWSRAVGRIAAYGVNPVKGDELGAELGVLTALRDFRDDAIEKGWPCGDGFKIPDQVWIDSGWLSETVYTFANESNRNRYRPMIGRGVGLYNSHKYAKPRALSNSVRWIGEEQHISITDKGVMLCEVNSDHWKTWVHERLTSPKGGDGSLTLFNAPAREHLFYARHLTSEKKVCECEPAKGETIGWLNDRGENHWFDATYIACAAAHFTGVRLVAEPPKVTMTLAEMAKAAGRK